jgi:cobalt/nickel transport system permease protein
MTCHKPCSSHTIKKIVTQPNQLGFIMHMADALLSPTIGAAFWIASGAAMVWSVRHVKRSKRSDLVPLMGVLGAFVFAAQMINFSIPGTGSSGHIVGGLMLSILLGPPAALLVLASVLTVQALFFADGGLLALGANLFNMGVTSCLVAYPLVYRTFMPRQGVLPSTRRIGWVAVLASVIGLQLGALAVVLQTQLSHISSLPLEMFLWIMQPIHLAIGLGEGLATAALMVFIRHTRPDLLLTVIKPAAASGTPQRSSKRLLAGFAGSALVTAGLLSWFASTHPDGLEWSIERVAGSTLAAPPASGVHGKLSDWQRATSYFKGYAFNVVSNQAVDQVNNGNSATAIEATETWPAVDAGTSAAGIVGGVVTLGLIMGLGYWLRRHESGRS